MSEQDQTPASNGRVSNADLSRRVERLEDGFTDLSRAVDNQSHQLEIVRLGQEHNQELMNTKFSGLEVQGAQTHSELRNLMEFIQKAMNATPEEASPQARAMMQEYRAFQMETREDIKQLRVDHTDLDRRKHKLREEFDDHLLVEKVKHETQATTLSRLFGGSVIGAVSGILGLILSAAALISIFANHPPV